MNIPPALKHLPRYHGLPIPWMAHVGKDGVPQFRVIDLQRNRDGVRFQLCGICGRWCKPPYSFVVGPLCVEERTVIGPPQHAECARASLTICPFLSQERWHRKDVADEARVFEKDELPPKPPRVGIAVCAAYRPEQGPSKLWYSTFERPLSVEWWVYRDGVLAPEQEDPTPTPTATGDRHGDRNEPPSHDSEAPQAPPA